MSRAYRSRCLSPTKLSRTCRRAFAPSAAISAGCPSNSTSVLPKVPRSAGSSSRMPVPGSTWSMIPPTRGREHCPALPHGLGDGEAESLHQTLLHHDGGVALERVHHGGVLVDVIHRQGDQVHEVSGVGGKRLPGGQALGEHLPPFGIIGDRLHLWSDECEVGVGLTRHGLDESLHDPTHVLQVVPPGDLDDQRITGLQRGAVLDDRRPASDLAQGAVVADEGDRRMPRHRAPTGRSSGASGCTSASDISWFFGENGSMDGGMTWTFDSSIHSGTYWRREKMNASQTARCGRRNDHASSVHCSGRRARRGTAIRPGRRTRPARRHPRGLGIVQEHHVTSSHQIQRTRRVRRRHRGVVLGLAAPSPPSSPRHRAVGCGSAW